MTYSETSDAWVVCHYDGGGHMYCVGGHYGNEGKYFVDFDYQIKSYLLHRSKEEAERTKNMLQPYTNKLLLACKVEVNKTYKLL